MNDKISATRAFTMEDQQRFAGLSGDRNPIHVDAVAARRMLFGAAVAHGVHTLLWSLDRICAELPEMTALEDFRAYFDAPAIVGEKVTLEWQPSGERSIRAKVLGASGNVLRLSLRYRTAQRVEWLGRTDQPVLVCEEPDVAELEGRERLEPLTLPLEWRELFPSLSERFSAAQVAVLLAATRVVGMKLPGLRSLFSALSLKFGHELETDTVRYSLARYDDRVKLLQITLSGRGVSGEAQVFRRPGPAPQASFDEISGLIRPGEFRGQRALVVGGSRGLGELTAKLLMAGGADVTVAYAVGQGEAERLVSEGRSRGLLANAVAFDVVGTKPAFGRPLTHLYYFATPKIPVGQPGRFRAEAFATLLDFYVKAFAATAEWLAANNGDARCRLWMPSTIYIEQEDERQKFPEYVAAKKCAEALCCQLNGLLPTLDCSFDRLPRLASDQTQSIVQPSVDDSDAVLLSILRKLA